MGENKGCLLQKTIFMCHLINIISQSGHKRHTMALCLYLTGTVDTVQESMAARRHCAVSTTFVASRPNAILLPSADYSVVASKRLPALFISGRSAVCVCV